MTGERSSGPGLQGPGMNGGVGDGPEVDMPDRSLPCMGDLVLTLLAGTLSALRDRLAYDGFADHAEVVADLVDVVDEYLAHLDRRMDADPPRSF